MLRRRGALLAWGLAFALALPACNGGSENGAPVPGGTLRVSVRDLGNLDPAATSGRGALLAISQLYDPLTTVDPRTGKAAPGAAEKWSVSPDGLTWTFTLTQATFHDGTPVDADAVKWSFDRWLDPNNPFHDPPYGLLSYYLGNIAGVPVIVHTYHGHVFHGYFSAGRTRVLFAFRELLSARRDELAKIVTSEHGKVESDAAGEVAERDVPVEPGLRRQAEHAGRAQQLRVDVADPADRVQQHREEARVGHDRDLRGLADAQDQHEHRQQGQGGIAIRAPLRIGVNHDDRRFSLGVRAQGIDRLARVSTAMRDHEHPFTAGEHGLEGIRSNGGQAAHNGPERGACHDGGSKRTSA